MSPPFPIRRYLVPTGKTLLLMMKNYQIEAGRADHRAYGTLTSLSHERERVEETRRNRVPVLLGSVVLTPRARRIGYGQISVLRVGLGITFLLVLQW
jgi:hypothetical protein